MVSRRVFRLGLVAALVILGVCETVILCLYVGAMRQATELSVELEFARGATLVASARAERCMSPATQP
jgi:hypothetical protein